MKVRIDRIFWTMLPIILLGYATMGRGFAYLGISPLFVGEVTLLVGLISLCSGAVRLKLPRMIAVWILLLFMVWCGARMVPYVSKFKFDALRDSAIWMYASYAIVIASLLFHSPERFGELIRRYRMFVWIFMAVAPVMLIFTNAFAERMPKVPGTDVDIVTLKGGDVCVHLVAAFAFVSLFVPANRAWPALFLVPVNLALNLLVRAGLVTFTLGTAVLMLMRPRSQLFYRMLISGALGVVAMWAIDLRIRPDPENPREVSVDQLFRNIASVVGWSKAEELDGTKEWRMNWWKEIVRYTVHGSYFWTGKGFGINLANDDGFQVEADETLRSPHNGHLTILARAGVPGLGLWIAFQTVWLGTIIAAYIRAQRNRERDWANLYIVLGVYWLAFLVNASFDVFLESPMGGIWYWTVMGVGIGAVHVHRVAPHILTEALAEHAHPDRTQFLPAARRRGRGLPIRNATAPAARA